MGLITMYALMQSPLIQVGLDTLMKSAILLGLVLAILSLIRQYISSAGAHLLLLATFIFIALTPIAVLLTQLVGQPLTSFDTLTVFTITSEASSSPTGPNISLGGLVVTFYLIGTLILLALLGRSAQQLFSLHAENRDIGEKPLEERFAALVKSLGISRPVKVKRNPDIQSPISYGLFQPIVLVPNEFSKWSKSIQNEVLLHELNHIKRFDWLSLIFTRVLCSLLWINPLIWIAAKRMNDESEQACDSAVVVQDADRVRYAEDLLNLAKQQRSLSKPNLLAQPMFDGGELTMRINNILEGKISNGISRTAMQKISICVLLLAVASGSVKLFEVEAANALDQEYLPIYSPNPEYPTHAIDDEAEGWILFSFTVTATGEVAPGSVNVVDADPAGYFEESSRSALLNFEFNPRVINGVPVEVPGVQYLFRYVLREDNPIENKDDESQ